MDTSFSFAHSCANSANSPSFDEKLELLEYLLTEEEDEITMPPAQSPLSRYPEGTPLYASAAQRRFWFLEHLHAEPALYTIPTAYAIQGELRVARLEQALNRIIQRHDILRTSFTLEENDCVPLLHAYTFHQLPLIDLTACPTEKRSAMAEQLIAEQARLPFDLTSGPLLRILLIRLERKSHRLLLTMHHSIADGESTALLLQEMAAFYRAEPATTLPALPLQYSDFALWQRQMLQQEELISRIQAWKESIAADMPALDLPVDYPAPAETTFHGALISQELPTEIVQQLQAFSTREGVTRFTLLLAAFQLLLARYTQQQTIIVGSPISGRTHQELEKLLGCFINTLAIRTNLSGNPSFLEFVRRVQASVLESYNYQDIPFEQLVSSLQTGQRTESNALFQVMFNYENTGLQVIQLEGLVIRPLIVDTATAKFALTLSISNQESGLTATIEYNTDLFASTTIARLLEHFQRVLQTVLITPRLRIHDFSLLSAQEFTLLAHEKVPRMPAAEESAEQSLARLFETCAQRFPDALALSQDEQTLTYQQLNVRANRLAHLLIQQGIGPERLVALFFERDIDLIIAMLAVLKAGGVYVPLDTTSPGERLALILQDSQATLVLSQQTLLARLPASQASILCLDEVRPLLLSQSVLNPSCRVTRQNLAYCIYTSGSTGTPRGVQVAHAQVLDLLEATRPLVQSGPGDAWTFFHSPAFDFSVWEIWGALLSGGRLVMVPYWIGRNPQAFWQLLLEQDITILNQTPSAFHQLATCEVSQTDLRVSRLRVIIFGGEALNTGSLQPWFEQWGEHGPTLINMYGITETTVHVTQRLLRREDLRNTTDSPIGLPLSNLGIYLLDPFLQAVPPGLTGEIYVEGSGLARGYLHQPALTAERFMPHPFSTQPGARLYRSGDLARRLASGELIYLGRADRQIKLRGFRVEPGEIEHILCQHPAIQTAVVQANGSSGRERHLSAYLVLKSEDTQQITTQQMRAYLLTFLPEHMVPTAYIVLKQLPLTTNHKIDFRALPFSGEALSEADQPYVAPRTANEQLLAEIWQEVLHVERIGLHDNFFARGGDSIRSIQILARARQHGLQFSLQQLFQHPNVYDLAQALQPITAPVLVQALPQRAPFSLVSGLDRERLPMELADAYPLTMLQAGMLYYMQKEPEAATYHNVFSLHLQAEFHLEHLQTALQAVTDRHTPLRTSFDLHNYSEPLQLVHQQVRPLITYENLRQLSEEEQESRVTAYIAQEERRPFDLACPPLLRIHIQQRSEHTLQFTLTENHAILDGWSLMSTLADLFDYHNAAARGLELPPHRPATSTFHDFVAHERAVLQSEEHRRYWQEKLRDYTFNQVGSWREADVALPSRVLAEEYVVPAEDYAELLALANRAALPLKSLLLAVHLKVMSMMSGQRDILTGLTSEGRPVEEGGERTRGLFLNAVPLRQELRACSWLELAETTFQNEIELLPFRDYPLAALQRDMGKATLFETLFTFLHFHTVAHLAEEKQFAVLSTRRSESTNFAINASFSLDPLRGGLSLLLDVDAARFNQAAFEMLAACYRQALHAMASAPESDHTHLSLLPPSVLQELVVDWNEGAPSSGLEEHFLHQLIEAQARRTPEAPAVIGQHQTLTYRALNEQANRLAHMLHQLHVGPEVPVVVCLERSPELVVCLLAILKAGGVYVPLDPHIPPQRLRAILESTGSALLLTQQELRAGFADLQICTLCLEEEQFFLDNLPAEQAPCVQLSPENLAYIIFTSGSTGLPRGVMIPHRGLSSYNTWAAEAYQVAAGSGSPLHTSIGFDLTLTSLFPALIAGRPVILCNEEQEHEELLSHLRERSYSLVKLTPAHLTLLDQLLTEEHLASPLPAQTFVIGGEALSAQAILRWQELAPGSIFINEYGPTEASVGCCIHRLEGPGGQSGSVPIGRPAAWMQLYLLDAFLQPVPPGVSGEIYLGGPGLARGYLAAAERTAECFLPDPFSARPGSRLYRTGDLARLLSDGNLDFVGRVDHQIKLRGFRIEPAEIVAEIDRHPAVQESLVLCQEGASGEKRLIAYYTRKHGAQMDEEALHAFLSQSLPEYMLPAVYVLLEAFPLTAHGKIERTALPHPQEYNRRRTPYVAPNTPLERLIAQIWREVLHLTEAGLEDNFLAMGGDSLSAMQIVSRLRTELQVELSLRVFLEHPTIAGLIALLDQNATQRQRLEKIALAYHLIAGLSDEEVQNMLASRKTLSGK